MEARTPHAANEFPGSGNTSFSPASAELHKRALLFSRAWQEFDCAGLMKKGTL